MTPVSIRVSDIAISAATSTYGAKVTGLQMAAEGFFQIRKRTIEELRGTFPKNEVFALCDDLNGTMLVPEYQANPSILWAHLEDGNQYEGLFAKWKIDSTAFQERIMALTAAQCFFLQDQIAQFWERGDALDDFVASM